jgi:2-hydroxychromene-2-carboxylate isomerase
MPTPLVFHYDVISPYAHVAWALLPALAARHGRELVLSPILFAGVLDHLGTKGPAEVPARRAYAFKDAARKAARAGLPPLVPPPAHPFNPLLALRVILAADPAARPAVTTALYRAVWVDGAGVDGELAVRTALERAGLDAAPLVAAAGTPAIKQQLRADTDAAIARGVFGVPTIFADGELFFGVDGLEALDDFLAGKDPIDRAQLDRWLHLPAAAVRRS